MTNFALEKKDEHKAVLISVDTGEFDAELSIAELMDCLLYTSDAADE